MKNTMQKNKRMKVRGIKKGLALGICAAILGTAGVAGVPQVMTWAYAQSYTDTNGKTVTKIFENGNTDTVTDESDETTAVDPGEATESAVEDFSVSVVKDDQNPDSKEMVQTTENIGTEEGALAVEEENYLYKALGLKWDKEQKAWIWKEKTVYAIWLEDETLTIYGNVKDEGENCLHITGEGGDGTATFKVEEMTKEELKKAYDGKIK